MYCCKNTIEVKEDGNDNASVLITVGATLSVIHD